MIWTLWFATKFIYCVLIRSLVQVHCGKGIASQVCKVALIWTALVGTLEFVVFVNCSYFPLKVLELTEWLMYFLFVSWTAVILFLHGKVEKNLWFRSIFRPQLCQGNQTVMRHVWIIFCMQQWEEDPILTNVNVPSELHTISVHSMWISHSLWQACCLLLANAFSVSPTKSL